MTKNTMPTPVVEVVSPAANSAISAPASVGPNMRDRLNVELCSAMALTR